MEFQKTQWIRALDVWALGPLMIVIAGRRKIPTWMRVGLAIGGTLTILYNAHNYILNAQIPKLPPPSS